MRILITGATGLIGKEVGKRLAAQGHELVVVSRNIERARWQLPFPAHLVRWKGESEPFPLEALQGVEAIVHLAGEPIGEGRWSQEKKRRIYDSRIFGTRALVRTLNENPTILSQLKVFVQGSAIGFYGDRGDATLDESASGGEGFLAELVRDWEAETDALESSTRLCKIRTGVVLSRREGALPKMLTVFSRGLGGRLGRGQQWMSWIHIVDIARLFVFCVETNEARGIFNGVAPESTRNERLTVELARSLNRSVFLTVPESLLKVALGEMAQTVLGGARVVPAHVLQSGFRFDYAELVPALRELCAPLSGGQHEWTSEMWLPVDAETLSRQKGQALEEIEPPRLCRQWRHERRWVPLANGTLLTEHVTYHLPFGIVGDALTAWKAHREVVQRFDQRKKQIVGQFLKDRI